MFWEGTTAYCFIPAVQKQILEYVGLRISSAFHFLYHPFKLQLCLKFIRCSIRSIQKCCVSPLYGQGMREFIYSIVLISLPETEAFGRLNKLWVISDPE